MTLYTFLTLWIKDVKMATSKYLRWLKEDELTTKVAKRFASFCEEDIEQRAKDEAFDADVYEAAVRLVLDKLEDKDVKATKVIQRNKAPAMQKGE